MLSRFDATGRVGAIGRGLRVAAMAAATATAVPAASAIVWSAAVDGTGQASDIIVTGHYVDSLTFGATTTVNGVTFAHIELGVPNTASYGVLSDYGVFDAGWDDDYRDLVRTTSYFNPGAQLEADFGVLAAGKYVMQVFMPQWDVNWGTGFSLNGVHSDNVQAGGYLPGAEAFNFYPRSKPQWISVQFDADGSTDFTLRTENVTLYQMLAAVQLRSLVPEPATWAMMIAGFGLVGTMQRRRRPETTG